MSAPAIKAHFSRPRLLWREFTRALADLLPKGLYARSLLIVIAPMVLLQTAVAYIFMERHWELVTHRLSAAVARDIGAAIELYRAFPPAPGDDRLKTICAERFLMDVELLPSGPLPPPMPKTFFSELDPVTRALPDEISKQIHRPFWIDSLGRSGLVEIRVDIGDGVLRMITHRNLAYEPNVHIFILWMLGASIVLLTVAILFLRNQIRPILRLADAAEHFGMGRDFDFRPHGAREVRQAGAAFIEMKKRVERALEQRTAMLNGVSHDLRTILTRFKLSLALIEDEAEIEPLQKDVEEMQLMLEAYLAFARGDGGEAAAPTDLKAMLEELKSEAERQGAAVSVEANGNLTVKLRPNAFKRCLANLVGNALRHGAHIALQASREQRFVSIHVDDDGPGIAPEHREDVFRPFYRLDEARNQDESGAGLGLAIARDIARAHGGDIALSTSPMGGLRASVRIPV
ncbi:MAG TPA: ATP-binding protein [Roseiarcus sp.]|nr:ATP-binding protein [Roseiarcus sp.]